jgi:hypothetical protein
MLTTLLLADSVKKGGPGSGPHPGSGGKSREEVVHNGYHTPVSTVVNGAKQNYSSVPIGPIK